jgi:predicted dienelactone hydrolase
MHPSLAHFSSGLQALQVHDAEQGISFPLLVQYPTQEPAKGVTISPYAFDASQGAGIAPGQFPLVLVSHGGGGSHLLYRSIATYLAQCGYVVAALEHPGNNRNNNALADTDANAVQRPRHASMAIDALLCQAFFQGSIDAQAIFVLGHSMGGYTALALVGAQPWSRSGSTLAVHHDPRVRAAVLMAPATDWFRAPGALDRVATPLMVLAGDKDVVTPLASAQLIADGLAGKRLVTFRCIPGAGHFSFLSPFPPAMCHAGFLPATDPPGFDRAAFHRELPGMVECYLRQFVHVSHG